MLRVQSTINDRFINWRKNYMMPIWYTQNTPGVDKLMHRIWHYLRKRWTKSIPVTSQSNVIGPLPELNSNKKRRIRLSKCNSQLKIKRKEFWLSIKKKKFCHVDIIKILQWTTQKKMSYLILTEILQKSIRVLALNHIWRAISIWKRPRQTSINTTRKWLI